MRRFAEAAAFVGLALGAHAVALALHPGDMTGATSSGEDGAAQVSLEAASAQVTEMVARWDSPPETVEAPRVMAVSPPETPDDPAPDASLARPAPSVPVATQGLALPQTERAPDIDREATAPLPPPVRNAQQMQDPDSAAPLRSGERPQLRPDSLRRPEPEPEPQRQAERQQAPSQTSSLEQRAAGAGSSGSAGNTSERQASTLSPGQRQSLARQYGGRIREALERRKRYPDSARGASGTVTVRIVVARSGRLIGASIVSSSGHSALDQAAVRAVRGVSFPAAPERLRDSQFSFTLPMNFSS